jgi:hypothetical protein
VPLNPAYAVILPTPAGAPNVLVPPDPALEVVVEAAPAPIVMGIGDAGN